MGDKSMALPQADRAGGLRPEPAAQSQPKALIPSAIEIDLRNLSQEHLAQCLPKMGMCSYAAPCIIGTLLPVENRERLDNYEELEAAFDGLGGTGIDDLIKSGIITIPDGQYDLACALQAAFDGGREDELRRLVLAAQGTEAGTATTGTGVVHDGPVAESDAS